MSDGPRLSYTVPLVIVGGGVVDVDLLADLVCSGASIVAADGGARSALEAGFVPDAVIGDLDSLGDVRAWRRRTEVIKVDDQNTTDFQKCLQLTDAPTTVGLGLTGKRFDHTLAALSAIVEAAPRRRIVLVDDEDLILGVHGGIELTVNRGDRVSVCPVTRTEFLMSRGLVFALDGLVLEPGGRLGTSNAATEGTFAISPQPHTPGPWLLVLDRKHLWALLAAPT